MRRRALAVAVLAVGVGCAMAGGPQAGAQSAEPEPRTPIRHFITLMQENHSFDNYFGTYPGADGIPDDVCMPRDLDDESAGCVEPYHLGNAPITDLGHSKPVFQAQLNDGAMDGFLDAYLHFGAVETELPMGYYDDRDIPFYWNVADEYVLYDRFFTSSGGGSVSNHMYWVAGRPGEGEDGEDIPDAGVDYPTIFDRLEDAGVSWKFYVQNYDPTITFRNTGNGDRASQIVWVPILNFPRFLDTPELFDNIVPLEEYFTDLENGTLPAVSYIVPSGASEHPPGSIQAGEAFVRTMLSALWRSSAWESSAFTWTYDDWGGWYDHVQPPQVDAFGLGFRAPTLLVSPYARRGHVDSTELDFTSYLAFIEHNWDLEPLAERDAEADPMLGGFDFDSPPRASAFLDRVRNPEPPDVPKRSVVYVSYAVALGVFGGVVLFSLRTSRRREAGIARAST